jgi:hypothetical protein
MIGQIQQSSDAGKWIASVCSREDVSSIVEIGTWNGMGSTKCVYEAIKDRNKKLISLEINKDMHEIAKNFYQKIPQIELFLGKITDELIDLNSLNPKFFSDFPIEVKSKWREQDLLNLSTCPNILHKLPEKIDFLILDGGEFTTFHEFNILKNRSNFIFLDDVNIPCIKNYFTRQELLKTSNLIYENLSERHGFSIFKFHN